MNKGLHPIMAHMGRVEEPLHVVDAVAPDALPGVSRPRHGEDLAYVGGGEEEDG